MLYSQVLFHGAAVARSQTVGARSVRVDCANDPEAGSILLGNRLRRTQLRLQFGLELKENWQRPVATAGFTAAEFSIKDGRVI